MDYEKCDAYPACRFHSCDCSSIAALSERVNEMLDKKDFDSENYKFAKEIFLKEEGREPNMNDEKDSLVVSILEIGIRYTKLKNNL